MNASNYLLLALVGVSLAACSDPKAANEANFSKVIQAKMAEDRSQRAPGCSRFNHALPFKTNSTEYDYQSDVAKFDALADAGLFTVEKSKEQVEKFVGFSIEGSSKKVEADVVTYTATAKLDKFLHPRQGFENQYALCYARPELVDVVRFSEPADMMGMRVSNVLFRYKMTDFAEWADALPGYGDAVALDRATATNPVEQTATLVLTSKGWSADDDQ